MNKFTILFMGFSVAVLAHADGVQLTGRGAVNDYLGDQDGACAEAHQNAYANAQWQCRNQGGEISSESDNGCNCGSPRPEVYTCTDSVQVDCSFGD